MNAPEELTTLASCPFCGSAAAHYGAAIRCTSFNCNAGLSPDWTTKAVRSVQCDPDERLRQAQVETAERWNRRAPQAAPAPSDGLREALTPSGSTKAAYIGEFSFAIECADEDGEPSSMLVQVPWNTIKEIMAAISTRAARSAPAKEGDRINWRNDPDAIVEDDEPQIGRDYA